MRPLNFSLAAAVTVAVLSVTAAQSSVDRAPDLSGPVKGWTAVAGLSGPAVVEMARKLPVAANAESDKPWCDSKAVVDSALQKEFDERMVTQRADGTSLWGSDVMGTWTVVLTRPDNVQCIVASGVGYEDGTNPGTFLSKVGLS